MKRLRKLGRHTTAEDALAAIMVEFDPLPAVVDMEAALDPAIAAPEAYARAWVREEAIVEIVGIGPTGKKTVDPKQPGFTRLEK